LVAFISVPPAKCKYGKSFFLLGCKMPALVSQTVLVFISGKRKEEFLESISWEIFQNDAMQMFSGSVIIQD